ncbi:alpha/beta fold hydrolase [Pseudomonas kurunegalensis]|uniref:alpha/beta fold hydrolase n=1 Tax=Pseudomonas kurunegalensis TaxID=485880 RepID=UPI002363C544|nr:alpha/beta hydrolase [Pseudomonas kurunegalensis]MDD2134573.1 alpha/beta hydrolase [Pseudomonas kurunegalensis]
MGKNIYSIDQGAGEAVVLVSGLGGLSAFWQPVVKALVDDYRVITFDHPGVGQSGIVGLPTIPGIVKALLSVLDERGVERAHIVGHSTGSLVTQAMALDHADRVKSITLSSGWTMPDKRFRDFFAYRQFLLAKLGGTAYNAMTRLVAYPSQWYGDNFAVEGELDYSAPSAVDVEMTQARMDMLQNYSRRSELNRINVPTCVIGAQDDFIIPFHHSEELARLIPGAKLIELSGGHFAPVTRTSAYTSLLRDFWESQQ